MINNKLEKCTPIMCQDHSTTDGGVIFESGGKFFQYVQISGELFYLAGPKKAIDSLDEIIGIMKREKKGRLNWKRYRPSTGSTESGNPR